MVALVGFGSAALSLGARESYVRGSEEAKRRRLRNVVSNQRFCVLPEARHPNLASAVQARSLRRLSSDWEAGYAHRVLLVVTFTDPARHPGACYAAANFLLAGQTSGYARRSGCGCTTANRSCVGCTRRRDAAAVLAAGLTICFSALSTRRANAPGMLASALSDPSVEHIVEVHVGEQRRNRRRYLMSRAALWACRLVGAGGSGGRQPSAAHNPK